MRQKSAPLSLACLIGVSTLLTGELTAQWTDDPAENTLLAGGAGDQVQPKMVPDNAGGFYLAWFSSTGGYDVWLQRFDGNGRALWNDGGLLVADRSFSSTEDYGLAVTPDGDAVLAYRGSGGSTTAMATRVDASGTIEWTVEAGSGPVNAPAIAVASDEDIVVAWIDQSMTSLRRLTPDGDFAWADPVSIDDGSNVALLADIQPGGDLGEVIVSFVSYASFTGAKRLKAMKVDAEGRTIWSGNRSVFTSGSLQFGSFPSFLPDGAGGALFTWYAVSPLQCHVQRLDAAGNPLFGTNGAAVTSSSSGYLRTNPTIAHDPASDFLAVAWVEQVPNTSRFAFSAQRFAMSDGDRLWTANGIRVGALATQYDILGSSITIADGACLLAWNPESSFANGRVLGQKLFADGEAAWSEPVPLCTTPSGHGRLTGLGLGDQAVFVWEDDRGGNEDLLGQNLRLDGTLGGACVGDINGDGQVDGADLNTLLASWGPCPTGGPCAADLDGNGVVDGADLNTLLGAWGTCG